MVLAINSMSDGMPCTPLSTLVFLHGHAFHVYFIDLPHHTLQIVGLSVRPDAFRALKSYLEEQDLQGSSSSVQSVLEQIVVAAKEKGLASSFVDAEMVRKP